MDKSSCSVTGCDSPVVARSLCNTHYRALKRGHDPETYVPRRLRKPELCAVSWCTRTSHAGSYCKYHYRAINQGRDPEGAVPAERSWSSPSQAGRKQYRDPEERFQARTEWDGDCLRWTGATNIRSGHGYFTATHNGRARNIYAHRYAWEREYGPLDPEVMLDHACRNPWCVNVEHLRIADKSRNGQNLNGSRVGSTTGFRNVFWDKQHARYAVRVTLKGQAHHGGFFTDLDEAAEAAHKLRKRLFGDFAGEG